VVAVATAVFEAAEVGITHQADVAGLRAVNHDDVVFVEVFALVYVFHAWLRTDCQLNQTRQFEPKALACNALYLMLIRDSFFTTDCCMCGRPFTRPIWLSVQRGQTFAGRVAMPVPLQLHFPQ